MSSPRNVTEKTEMSCPQKALKILGKGASIAKKTTLNQVALTNQRMHSHDAVENAKGRRDIGTTVGLSAGMLLYLATDYSLLVPFMAAGLGAATGYYLPQIKNKVQTLFSGKKDEMANVAQPEPVYVPSTIPKMA